MEGISRSLQGNTDTSLLSAPLHTGNFTIQIWVVFFLFNESKKETSAEAKKSVTVIIIYYLIIILRKT